MREPATGSIETVREPLGEADAAVVRELWAASGTFGEADAHARLGEVRCLVRDEAGAARGLSWAYPDTVALAGGRRFWMYQSLVEAESAEAGPALLAHTFAALEEGFDPDARGPIGVCAVLRDPAEMRARPEAEWAEPRMVYAGYLPDGGQVRVGYFAGATV